MAVSDCFSIASHSNKPQQKVSIHTQTHYAIRAKLQEVINLLYCYNSEDYIICVFAELHIIYTCLTGSFNNNIIHCWITLCQ